MIRPFTDWRTRHGIDRLESEPSYTLEEHIASLRDRNPKRWAELQAEWEER